MFMALPDLRRGQSGGGTFSSWTVWVSVMCWAVLSSPTRISAPWHGTLMLFTVLSSAATTESLMYTVVVIVTVIWWYSNKWGFHGAPWGSPACPHGVGWLAQGFQPRTAERVLQTFMEKKNMTSLLSLTCNWNLVFGLIINIGCKAYRY